MLAAAVLTMVLILLAITYAPRIYAWFFARREHYVHIRRAEPTLQDLVAEALGQMPDAAEDTADGVVLYSGGASSPNVVLQKRVLNIPLSVAYVDDDVVRFHGSGGFEVVASGAMAHADFGLTALSGGSLVDAKARDPLAYVPPKKTGALVEQKYGGYYNDNIGFFASAPTIGEPVLTTVIRKGDEGSRYSYMWTGVFRPQQTGTHEFWTRSDDASHVFIDGIKVVDNSGIHGAQDRSGSIELAADKTYAFEVYFGENEGGAEMLLQWHGPGQSWQTDLAPVLAKDAPASDPNAHKQRDFAGHKKTASTKTSLDAGVVRFAHFGPDSRRVLQARKDQHGRASPCYAVQLLDAKRVIAAHDLSSASTPVVSELCKSANMQALSIGFSASASDASSVSVYVLPRRQGLPPVSMHVAFKDNDLMLTYLLQKDAADVGPQTVAERAAAQTDRDTVLLPGARSGQSDVMVFVETVRGRIRAITIEPNRELAFMLQAPTFLRDDEPLRTDALDPPATMVTSKNVDDLVVVPFCVGDLRNMMK